MKYVVKTQDVDGRGSKSYASLKGAVKRFEEMVGYTTDQVIAEVYHDREVKPTIDCLKQLRGVSMYGTVVTFRCMDLEAENAAAKAYNAKFAPGFGGNA